MKPTKLTMAEASWRYGFISLGTGLMQSAAEDGLAQAMMRLGNACEHGEHGRCDLGGRLAAHYAACFLAACCNVALPG